VSGDCRKRFSPVGLVQCWKKVLKASISLKNPDEENKIILGGKGSRQNAWFKKSGDTVSKNHEKGVNQKLQRGVVSSERVLTRDLILF